MLGAGSASEYEEDVAVLDLTLADDPGHPPPGRSDHELEVRAGTAGLPDPCALLRNLLKAALACNGHEPLRPKGRPGRGGVGRLGENFQRCPVEGTREPSVTYRFGAGAEHEAAAAVDQLRCEFANKTVRPGEKVRVTVGGRAAGDVDTEAGHQASSMTGVGSSSARAARRSSALRGRAG